LHRLDFMAKLCKGEKILDVGYSQEPNLYLMGEVYGIDINLTYKPKNYIKIIKVDLNSPKIPFKDNSFDSVIAGEIIEHLENPMFFLRECRRILKYKGKLILSTHHSSYWSTVLHNWFFFNMIPDWDKKAEHINNWSRIEMFRILKKAGFCVKNHYGDQFIFPKPLGGILFRVKMRKFPILSLVIIYECMKINFL